MSLCLKSSLLKLARLSVERLHQTAVRIRKVLAGAEWKMGVCLLAMSRGKRHFERGFSSVVEYAEKSLKLSRKKAYLLLATARALEHLPLTSIAYQLSEICWSKIRALQSVLTPETEAEWLTFAFDRSAHEVSKAVAMSPTAWKGQRALEASKAAAPIATPGEVQEIVAQQGVSEASSTAPTPVASMDSAAPLSSIEAEAAAGESSLGQPAASLPLRACSPVIESSPASSDSSLAEVPELVPGGDQGAGQDSDTGGTFVKPALPDSTPKKIRLTIDLTPDQYAIFEVAQRHARAQMGRRANIAQVLVHMSERLLDSGTARTRVKHQIIIHTTPEQEHGWYQTDKGILPVSAEILNQAKAIIESSDAPRPKRAERKNASNSEFAAEPQNTTEPGTPTELKHGIISQPVAKPDCHDNAPGQLTRPEILAELDPETGPEPVTDPAPVTTLTLDAEPMRAAVFSSHPNLTSRTETQSEMTGERKPGSSRRKDIPMATLRAVFQRADHCCQRCGESAEPLQIHHKRPVSEGGTNDLESLELLCPTCHSGHHEQDYLAKPHWAAARNKAVERKEACH